MPVVGRPARRTPSTRRSCRRRARGPSTDPPAGQRSSVVVRLGRRAAAARRGSGRAPIGRRCATRSVADGDRRQRHPRVGERRQACRFQGGPTTNTPSQLGGLGGRGELGDAAGLGQLPGQRDRSSSSRRHGPRTDRRQRKTGADSVASSHGTLRPRRPPQRGQELAVQRPHRRRRARRAVRRSPPRTRTSASPRCPTSASTGWPRCPRAATSCHAAVQVVDIGGLVEGASKGEGLGNKFLANIREVDAIVFVLRAFVDDDVDRPDRSARAPARRRDRAGPRRPRDGREAARPGARGSPSSTSRSATRSRRCRPPTTRWPRARPLYRAGLKAEHRELLRAVLPAHQPAGAGRRQRRRGRARRDPRGRGARCAPSSTTPATTSRSSACACSSRPRRRRSTTPTSGPRCSRASASARAPCSAWSAAAYHLLGLRTFLTTGEKESRAWTFYAGSKAPAVRRPDPHRLPARLHPGRGHPLGRAARRSARGPRPRSVGKIRVEGKDYEFVDGDVMEFRFNV